MTPREAVVLTGYLQAHFPQQPVNEFTPEALHEQLAPFTLDDCRAAVKALAETGEKWCAPTQVGAQVRRIRARRIDATMATIAPPADMDPDDTRAYSRWLGQARRDAANGVAAPVAPAVVSGPSSGEVRALVEGTAVGMGVER